MLSKIKKVLSHSAITTSAKVLSCGAVATSALYLATYNKEPEIKLKQLGFKVQAYVEPTLFPKKMTVKNVNFVNFIKLSNDNSDAETYDKLYPKTHYKEQELELSLPYEITTPSCIFDPEEKLLFSYEYPSIIGYYGSPRNRVVYKFKEQCSDNKAYTEITYNNNTKKIFWQSLE